MDDLTRDVGRWLAADERGDDEEADAACRGAFATAVAEDIVPAQFAAETIEAIALATARDRASARRVRRALALGGSAAAVGSAYYLGPVTLSASWSMLLGLLDLFVGMTVRVAAGMQAGADFWSLLGSLGRALGAFVSDPAVTIAMLAMQGIAIAALFALQRLLGSDRESLK